MAGYNKQSVNDGFMRAASVGVSVQKGVSVALKAKITVKAKTVSNVFKELQKRKQHFSEKNWETIHKAHAEAKASFFFLLLKISAGGNYDYENKYTETEVKDSGEAQQIAQALQSTDETEVTIEGEIQATGTSFVPVKAYMFIQMTQMQFDEGESFNAVADNPEARAAGEDGSSSGVSGSGKLNTIDASNLQRVMKHEKNLLNVETLSAKFEVVPAFEKK